MELNSYLDALRRRWLTVAVTILITVAVVAGSTLLMTPLYTAQTRVFFAVQGTESVTDLAQGSTFAEKQMTSYAEVAQSPLVLGPVIDQLDLLESPSELAERLTVTVPVDTVIVEVSATDPSADQAARIANAVGAQLSKAAASLSPERRDGQEAVRATILAPAQLPIKQSSPEVLRNLVLALTGGLILGVAIALLRDGLDTKVRSEGDLKTATTRPVLGVIAFDEGVPQHPLIIRESPQSAPSEAVRRLRTNLQYVDVAGHSNAIVVTSSIPGEGKSTTAINLAVSMADAGSRVLLIDADLRRPSVANYMGLEGAVGLTTVLIGKAELSDVVQPWDDGRLQVLPAGQIPPNPSELLGSRAMISLLAQLSSEYDTILLDSPPLLPVTDAVVLSKLCGGALVLVGANQTHRAQLRSAITTLETAGAHVFGVVMNKTARRNSSNYNYYYSSDLPRKVAASPRSETGVDSEPDEKRMSRV